MNRFLSRVIPLACAAALAACDGPRTAPHDVVDARARLMLDHLRTGRAPVALHGILGRQSAPFSLRFDRALTADDADALARAGVRLMPIGGAPARVGTVYSGDVPWETVGRLAQIPGLVRAEPAWRPARLHPLDRSIPEVGADAAWRETGAAGGRLDGTGVIVADIDTGVDYLHPAFFFDDGGEFDWIDVDNDGAFTPGVDAVDLNRNGQADPGERLNFIDTATQGVRADAPENAPQDGVYDARTDWLYNDADGSGAREQGMPAFTEDTPSLGEALFVARDINGNGRLDVGERVAMLKTGKVRAMLNGKTIYRRGQDLMLGPLDDGGHGTRAAAVVLGGQIGMQYTGVAPGAGLILINGFAADFDAVAAFGFARDEGAKVILHEYSSWVFTHMDGTTNEEAAIDALADEGVLSVVPARNLGGVRKHALLTVPAGAAAELPVGGPGPYAEGMVSLHFRSADPSLLTVTINGVTLPADGTGVPVGTDTVWSAGDTSPAGTYRLDVEISSTAGTAIGPQFDLQVAWRGAAPLTVHAYAADSDSGWGEGFSFTDADERYTVTWPANASKALSVASYNTRYDYKGRKVGDLSIFSGVGPRIDEAPNVHIAAPGGYDLITPAAAASALGDLPFGSYGWFGGTSGAGPHVAGAAAIAWQAMPGATAAQVAGWLIAGARRDAFTGPDLPTDAWGYGKLDIPAMLAQVAYDGGPALIDAGTDAAGVAVDGGTPDGAAVTDARTIDDAEVDAGGGGADQDGGTTQGCSCATIGL